MKITEEMIEIIENSFLGDLYDALEIETDPEIRELIQNQINKILS